MALKYYIEYNDTVNVLHRFELYDDNYIDPSIEVQGYVNMDYGQVSENLESIRGQGLRVYLEANENLTFEDLFTEEERTIKAKYYRAGVILFEGWLNPEGFFEDYVNDKWVSSFDCIDGLGYMKNLAFVNQNGLNITGVKSQLEILSIALKRTGLNSNINVAIDIFYTGLSDTESILENVKANSSRYIKDDEITVMSCEEVIKDVLEPYGAVLTPYNGEWYIYKPNQIFSETEQTFFRYDYEGVLLSPSTKTHEFELELGSKLDDFYPHYCNGNQKFTNKPSFGAYRISYKYGLRNSLVDNSYLQTLNGSTVPGFTIVGDWTTVGPPDSYGVYVPCQINTIPSVKEFENNSISVDSGTNLLFETSLKYLEDEFEELSNTYVTLDIIVELTDGQDTYTLAPSGSWTTGNSEIYLGAFDLGVEKAVSLDILNTPIAGDLKVIYKTPIFLIPEDPLVFPQVKIYYFSLINTTDQSGKQIEGETFTFQRQTKPSARIADTKEVKTGDSPLDLYKGTLYKADGVTSTETWYRKGVTESLPILSLMGSETMRINANTMRIFSGDIFGYFNYLSVISLDQRVGKFGITKYSYDTKNNIISAEFKQMFGGELTDLDIERAEDYGNVVEPTIRG